ncbi:hypothetical protein HYW76_00335 [Candidatus Pacearchaeota archaeon]|nr:hypothetical protein [Candidatus Pacearchaeota archaeon]
MKKSIILFILIIFLSAFVYAEEQPGDAGKIAGKTAVSAVLGTNAFLERDIVVPENLQLVARVLFGLKENTDIAFSEFVVLCAVWIMLFIIIIKIMVFMPFLNKGIQKFAGALIITCLASIAGGLLALVALLLDLSSLFGIFNKYSVVTLVIGIILSIVIVLFASLATNKIITSSDRARAATSGLQAGATAGMLQQQGKTMTGR